jgi:hypothetical protein
MQSEDDDANPVAMCVGLLLGMSIGLVIMAGAPAWRTAASELCRFAAIEAGNLTAGCGTTADARRFRIYP